MTRRDRRWRLSLRLPTGLYILGVGLVLLSGDRCAAAGTVR